MLHIRGKVLQYIRDIIFCCLIRYHKHPAGTHRLYNMRRECKCLSNLCVLKLTNCSLKSSHTAHTSHLLITSWPVYTMNVCFIHCAVIWRISALTARQTLELLHVLQIACSCVCVSLSVIVCLETFNRDWAWVPLPALGSPAGFHNSSWKLVL